ncbi:hypothetical protein Nepgr_010793 [Nepenthes gracilis]|uniref:Uncharacterized protein n=1 Tax=Nepenthes gracilis TaxID=150966 RepID=A0AAD3XLC9_NEPGR|nr:hypothetical protein Nepgr_010793 [Nepenthes gracilis]
MVSVNPTSPEGFYLDANGMALPGLNPFTTPTASTTTATNTSSSDDPDKKVRHRKTYTITKSRESWTEPEHDKFFEALQLFDRDWKKIKAYVGSKSVIQIRSHAQKYFLKVQKSGSSEHLPPPRPKRKAAHPYPQKAPKNEDRLESKSQWPDSASILRDTNHSGAVVSSWTANSLQAIGVPRITKVDTGSAGPLVANNCCTSTESTLMPQAANEMNEQVNHGPTLRVLPDFVQVYSFIGSVFDPDATDHLRRLKKMDPIDIETVLLLMRNFSINFTSPDFEDHQRKLLASYEIDTEKANSGGAIDNFNE